MVSPSVIDGLSNGETSHLKKLETRTLMLKIMFAPGTSTSLCSDAWPGLPRGLPTPAAPLSMRCCGLCFCCYRPGYAHGITNRVMDEVKEERSSLKEVVSR